MSFDFLDFTEGMFPGIQVLFKFIVYLLIVGHVGIRLVTIILFFLCLVWIYPDIKNIIKKVMEASK